MLSAGARTPAGLTLPASAAAVRSGVNAYLRTPYFRDRKQGLMIPHASVHTENSSRAIERIRSLAKAAAGEALAGLPGKAQSGRIAVLLALPEERPTIGQSAAQDVAQELIRELGVPVLEPLCRLWRTGNAGGLALLEEAGRLLGRGEVDMCLLGGADSHLDMETLHWLEDSGRLHREEEPNGMIPSEAAAFLALTLASVARRQELPALSLVTGAGVGSEPHPWYTRQPSIGQGLTQALSSAFSAAIQPGGAQVSRVYCDLNGESWRADEWGYAYLRMATQHKSPLDVAHPANCWGDVGAASGPLLAALATADLESGFSPGDSVSVWCSSGTNPMRGACVLTRSLAA